MPSLKQLGGNLALLALVFVGQTESDCIDRQATRIVGGVHANPGEFPFIVRFTNSIVVCGGSIIDDRHILTAAHCFFDPRGNEFIGRKFISTGCHNRERCQRQYDVSGYVTHENFRIVNSMVFPYDIAVLRTREQIQFRPGGGPGATGPVQLASNLNDDVRDSFVTIGWGDQEYQQLNRDPILRKVSVANIPLRTCKQHYRSVNEKMICAGQRGKDSCQGDSGGPMLVRVGNGRYKQVGIVSSGDRCGSQYGGLYTRVAAYRQWIQDAIRRLSSQDEGSYSMIDRWSDE